ncbi:MAG: PIN domain-containing protein [Acidobacteria bacterium]|uniref:Ribonuclease VapC n=1 Tax=Candidatus Polarisedimenticola svalbardensis TaxID=2886004 RepID=A0A8J7CDZ1_9BACT|nr:PIN domain-containing protein [Candidatus Polarisedimenticola svalbardensis]
MILVDAGPLIALIDRGEQDHIRCVEALADLTTPMVTTWPAFTEAMYLLGSAGGWKGQAALWKLLERGDLQLVALDEALQKRTQALMGKYRDTPMDLADASLVAAAEALDTSRVFTLDSDFEIYRWKGRRKFEVVPGPL